MMYDRKDSRCESATPQIVMNS